MPNYNQAPRIKHVGNKMTDRSKMGFAQRSHEVETAIMCGLGERDMAMLKIMLFLTGNAEGFQVPESTICQRCNISPTGYKNARRKLVEKGWLRAEDGYIVVDFNAILSQQKQGSTENTPIPKVSGAMGSTQCLVGANQVKKQTSTENTSISVKGSTENTPIFNNQEKQTSTENTPSKIGVNSEYPYSENIQSQGVNSVLKQGSTENTYNNIREQDNIIKVTKSWVVENGYAQPDMGKRFYGRDGRVYEISNEVDWGLSLIHI